MSRFIPRNKNRAKSATESAEAETKSESSSSIIVDRRPTANSWTTLRSATAGLSTTQMKLTSEPDHQDIRDLRPTSQMKVFQKMDGLIFGGFDAMAELDAVETDSDTEEELDIDWDGFDADDLVEEGFFNNHFADDEEAARAIHQRRDLDVCTVIDNFYKDAFVEEIRSRNSEEFFDNREGGNVYSSALAVNLWEFRRGSDEAVERSIGVRYGVVGVQTMDSNDTPCRVHVVTHLDGIDR